MIYGFMDAQKAGFPIRLMCRRLGVSPAGFYEWQGRRQQPSPRAQADAVLTATIGEIHRASDGTYGSPSVWADLRLGAGIRVSRKRVERLMRQASLQGISRRKRGCTRRNPADLPAEDLVHRRFKVEGPDRLWVADITEHPTREGKVYAAVVIDAWSRRMVGLSIADHLRAELVCDALDAATWRRRPRKGATVFHSDHGCQYTAWTFGQRLRKAGLLGSMGSVGDALDNAVAESFFASLQTELLDRRVWDSRHQLAQAIFAWVEAWYNPRRRHSALGYLSPIQYEATHKPLQKVA